MSGRPCFRVLPVVEGAQGQLPVAVGGLSGGNHRDCTARRGRQCWVFHCAMKRVLFLMLLTGLGCSSHGYRSDGNGYLLYRSRMMTPESSDYRGWAFSEVPGRALDKDDPLPDESQDLFDTYSTFRP